jgi:hypothetical protein
MSQYSIDQRETINREIAAGVKRREILRLHPWVGPSWLDARMREAKQFKSVSAVNIETAPRAVDRDPCPRCGVRADVGCSYAPVHFGMTSRIGG